MTDTSGMPSFPKDITEMFIADPHGEYDAFSHIVRSACGQIKREIDALFEDLSEDERRELATLVYYPVRKMELELSRKSDADEWLKLSTSRLETLWNAFHARCQCDKMCASAMPGTVPELCEDIQRMAGGYLHMVGDVYDRGPAPELIMDELAECDHMDIQWGNHDDVWMGASLGQRGCIAHVVRNCARYANLSILEDAYGMDLEPLTSFAMKAYGDDPCVAFGLKGSYPDLSPEELERNIKIQKAMAILQFKVEAKLIDENPTFGLEDRKQLHLIDRETNTIVVDGVQYELADTVFPTVDWQDPYRLTDEEEAVMAHLEDSFKNCERLQRHIALFLDKGSLYTISGRHLVYHACVPLNPDGSLKEVDIYGKTYKGRALFDAVDRCVRDAFSSDDAASRKRGADLLWYLWLGAGSPLFAKSKMATFEIYLIADKEARKEVKNPFYSLIEDASVVDGIFEDFGMDPKTSRIICGHVPVKVKDGEDPVKCGGKVVMIDGGMSAAYHATTGIAGFTIISGAEGDILATHEPFGPVEDVIANNLEMQSTYRQLDSN